MENKEQQLIELLQENIELSKENNRLLRGIRTAGRIGMLWNLFYLALVVGSIYFSYAFLKPFLAPVFAEYQSLMKLQDQAKAYLPK
jgi:hypothetical protein